MHIHKLGRFGMNQMMNESLQLICFDDCKNVEVISAEYESIKNMIILTLAAIMHCRGKLDYVVA